MSYIYSIKIALTTQDDINAKFRKHGLEGELFVSQLNEFYICPQLSYTKWSHFPQSKTNDGKIDNNWDKAIEETVAYLVDAYSMSNPTESIGWVKIEKSYRCPRMESYIREFDLK